MGSKKKNKNAQNPTPKYITCFEARSWLASDIR
jgi:hypothetical protein